MQKHLQRLLTAAALAASVSLWAAPQTAALTPAQEEPALYYDQYGAEFYLTADEAADLLDAGETEYPMQPVVVDFGEEEAPEPEEEPGDTPEEPADEEEDPAESPIEEPELSLKDLDAAFAVTPVDDPALYEEQMVSVTVTWGAMEFAYNTGDWDPETLTYATSGTEGWQAVNDSNTITLTNNGTAVDVVCSYEPKEGAAYTAKDVTFWDASRNALFTNAGYAKLRLPGVSGVQTAVQSLDTLEAVANEAAITVKLSGPRPAVRMEQAKIGTITVTVSLPETTESGEEETGSQEE